MEFSIGIASSPMDPMDSIGTTFYPLHAKPTWVKVSHKIEHRRSHRNRFVSDGSDGYHRRDFLPPHPTKVNFFKVSHEENMDLFIRNRFVSERSPPLVGLCTSALLVFRSRGRGYDWNLVDSIGQPSKIDFWVYKDRPRSHERR